MPTSGMGSQYHSISLSGMMIFEQGPFVTNMGGMVIDLASAPIEPGDYTMEIRTGMGGVEVYLPRYVQFTIDGGAVVGGTNIHEGLGLWKGLMKSFQGTFSLPNQVPDHAVAPANPERPVRIHFVINTGMGGVDMYRL